MSDRAQALSLALLVLRCASPAFVLLGALSLIPLKPVQPSTNGHGRGHSDIIPVVVATHTPRRALILSLLSLSALSYLLDGAAFVIDAVLWKRWLAATGLEANAVLGVAAFAGLAALGAYKDVRGADVWGSKRVRLPVVLSTMLDIAQVVIYGITAGFTRSKILNPETIPALLHLAFPVYRLLCLIPLIFALYNPRISYSSLAIETSTSEQLATDSSLLLPSNATPSTGLSPVSGKDGYGTFQGPPGAITAPTTRGNSPAPSHAPLPPPKAQTKSEQKKESSPDPTWSDMRRRLKRISPYLWPSKSRGLQTLALMCLLILAVGRIINILLPLTLGALVSSLDHESSQSPWPYLFAYVGLRYLQGSGGLSAIRSILWIPVTQYSDREMSSLSFSHLLNLSLAFHTRRKTGEVLRILDRGASINNVFEMLLFTLLPTALDITFALVIFTLKFDWTLAILVFFVMVAYVASSVIMTRWRTRIRRQMNDRDMITRAIHTDCLLNYETVKYFNGEQHESERYQDSIRQYQALEYKVMVSLNLLNLVQNFIISLGLLVGSLIVALRVVRGDSTPADFIIWITYLAQLYGPLGNLGYLYRAINTALVDAEKLLNLLDEPTDVNDRPDAPDLLVTDGAIEFDNVSFSYDGRTTAINGVSFKVPKGSSVALVGESGSGKSTVLRLLYRFYDLQEGDGRILIDGQDIRDVTQSSLRKAIGVVPQDTVLFNASIEYNIGYGKFGSSSEEIEAAAKAAQMHDRIMSFPDAYETKVGERGVRLSGGEKQRVAIARTLLKNPPILLLDEATSALDTSTERDIQKALQNLVKGRTSLSIAHRLSTIASSDVILVLKDGQIVESGSHSELLAANGIFATMWADQVAASEDGVQPSDTGDLKEISIAGLPTDAPTQDSPVVEERPIAIQGYNAEPLSRISSVATPTEAPEEEKEGEEEPSVATTETAPAPAADESGAMSAEPSYADVVRREPSQSGENDASTHADEPSIAPAESTEPVTFPSSASEEPVAFPASAPEDEPEPTATPTTAPPAAIAFPGGDSSSVLSTPAIADGPSPGPTSPGVTFVGSPPPERATSPDPDAEPKRRRISSQNFQRLARRISISRRAGSSTSVPNTPGLKRESTDTGSQQGESTPNLLRTDSPAGSSEGGKKEKKEKEKGKEKEKKGWKLKRGLTSG